MTMAVAPRARAMSLGCPPGPGSGAAGGAREEDDALGVARDVAEVADHARLAATTAGRGGHRGPHPEVELAAKLVDEALLVLGDPDVPLGEHDLAVSRLHPQQPHRRTADYGKRRVAGGHHG